MTENKKDNRMKDIPEYKIKMVSNLANKIKKSKTVLVASIKSLPSSQFHEIKKNLRGTAEISVAKRSLVIRAIENSNKTKIKELTKIINADIALFFSDLDPFSLSGLLADNRSSMKAKTGDIAPEDITIEPGPTTLVPGPAISELSGVGLKVAVEGGKLAIKLPATIVHAGETIKSNVASVLGKLGITPMKVGFEPLAAYDSNEDKVYFGIKIDKKATVDELRISISKSISFSVYIGYASKENIKYLFAKAQNEERVILNIYNKAQTNVKEGQ